MYFKLVCFRDVEIIAIAIDEQNMWMHCVFDDHSFVVYNVLDLNSSQLHTLHHFHGSCVWDVKVSAVAMKVILNFFHIQAWCCIKVVLSFKL